MIQMRGNSLFSLQSIGDVYMLVPLQDEKFHIERILSTNEVGALLWNMLKNDCTEDTLADAVVDEYEISRETALSDIRNFLESLKKIDALIP